METGRSLGVEVHGGVINSATPPSEEDMDLRRGPWTVEEDLLLVNYIANHGEGRWNSLARHAGLRRTGKSCRLRWLNYLRPDVRRGNITPEEQLLILELHSRWGNRWSKIAQHLPGRTDNEIKNYWRTRVQKHAKQLRCDVNSKKFKDIMRYLWIPRLLERIRAASAGSSPAATAAAAAAAVHQTNTDQVTSSELPHPVTELERSRSSPESSSFAGSSSVSEGFAGVCGERNGEEENRGGGELGGCWGESLFSPGGFGHQHQGFMEFDQGWWNGDISDNLWNVEDSWFLQ